MARVPRVPGIARAKRHDQRTQDRIRKKEIEDVPAPSAPSGGALTWTDIVDFDTFGIQPGGDYLSPSSPGDLDYPQWAVDDNFLYMRGWVSTSYNPGAIALISYSGAFSIPFTATPGIFPYVPIQVFDNGTGLMEPQDFGFNARAFLNPVGSTAYIGLQTPNNHPNVVNRRPWNIFSRWPFDHDG